MATGAWRISGNGQNTLFPKLQPHTTRRVDFAAMVEKNLDNFIPTTSKTLGKAKQKAQGFSYPLFVFNNNFSV
jgi:hypothetical protein